MAAFVKFSRGLISSYTNLANKDKDTLYLVYERQDSKEGKLYLGDKLISSVNNSSSLSLNDLLDVSVQNPADGMILQYNAHTAGQVGESGKWEAVSVQDAINNAQTATNNISFAASLDGLNPEEEKIVVVGEDIYIGHDNEWVHLTNSELSDRIDALEDIIGHAADTENDIPATGLYKEIADLKENTFTKSEILEQIADLSHLSYKKVNALNDIDVNADEASTTIYLVPKTPENDDGYDEYFVIDGALEKIGNFAVSSEALLSEDDRKKIDSLGLNDNDQATINYTQVTNLTEAIQDNQLIKHVQTGVFNITNDDSRTLELVSIPANLLSDYVKTSVVGDLSELRNRISNDSTLVDEINLIKTSITWQNLESNSTGE